MRWVAKCPELKSKMRPKPSRSFDPTYFVSLGPRYYIYTHHLLNFKAPSTSFSISSFHPLRETRTLPCNDLHGKDPYTHGKTFAVRASHSKGRTTVSSMAATSLPCASPMLHGCASQSLPCAQDFAVHMSVAVRQKSLLCKQIVAVRQTSLTY
jgi:hypothetical protein